MGMDRFPPQVCSPPNALPEVQALSLNSRECLALSTTWTYASGSKLFSSRPEHLRPGLSELGKVQFTFIDHLLDIPLFRSFVFSSFVAKWAKPIVAFHAGTGSFQSK